MGELADATVLITGVGRGLGRDLAIALSRHGANIAAIDVDLSSAEATAEAVSAVGGTASAHQADVTSEPDVTHVVADVTERFGKVDLLVNNAGVLTVNNVVDMPVSEWRRVLEVNATGAFLMAREVTKAMIATQSQGSIINIASIAGKRGDPGLAHYSASKFAVIGLTQALAQEVGAHGITVNAVCPGVVDTPMLAELAEAWHTSVDGLAARQVVTRPQTPGEIADTVVYLHRCRSITGQSINVDGGTIFS
ncbi:MAG: SDR family oxidoreductase [Cryobacterium sp.]|nr:SDR family oxidoreductase [Cryobacterium sp.]